MIARELKGAYKDSLKIIERNVVSYIRDDETSAYKPVAVELRKLLLDRDSPRSFGYHNKTIFELCAGKANRIYLHSFDERRARQGHSSSTVNFRSITPLIFLTRKGIINSSRNSKHLVSLDKWLNESPFFGRDGKPITVKKILLHIADKEGAHIINQRERDIRPKMTFKLTSESTKQTWHPDVWEDFVISAGARLLLAQKRKRGKSFRIFPDMLRILTNEDENSDVKVDSQREDEILVELQLDIRTFK